MRVLVVASSFPALHQPWINTHLRQLAANGIDFSIVSLKEQSSHEDRAAAADLLSKCLFLTREPRRHISAVGRHFLRHPLRCLDRLLRSLWGVARLRVGVRETFKLALFNVYLLASTEGLPARDLIHVHFDQDALLFLVYAQMTRTPLVTTFHGLNPRDIPRMDSRLRRAVYRHAHAVLANTRFACQQAGELGCRADKLHVLPQGLEVHRYEFVSKQPPVSPTPLNLLTVGRLSHDKGQGHAMLAAARLVKAGHSIRWRFVGFGPDLEKLVRLRQRLGLEKHVEFVQGVPSKDLQQMYREAHVFVLPSTSNTKGYHVETQGVVLQEAQASGAIVVASNVGGIPECIHADVDGFLVRQRSARDLSACIQRLLAEPQSWAALQAAGRENVIRSFAADRIGERMRDFYQKIVGGRR